MEVANKSSGFLAGKIATREGFNVKSTKQHNRKDMSKARIGILGNNEDDCGTL